MRPSMVAHASNPALRRLEQENAKSRQLGLQIPNFLLLKHPHVHAMTFVCEPVSSAHCGLQGLHVGRQAWAADVDPAELFHWATISFLNKTAYW